MDEGTLEALARRMLSDYDAVTPGMAFADGLKLSIADAWRLQAAVATLRHARGERLIGYKIGATSDVNRKMLGLDHPAWGRLWSSELHESGAELRKADFANVALEAEFAVILCRDVTAECSPDAILSAIEAVCPVIEIHNLMLRGDPPHGAELLANNAINAGVVKGAPITHLTPGTVTDLSLLFDGEIVDAWASLTWPDDILSEVAWLAKQRAADKSVLKAGQLILTGAYGPPISLNTCTRVDVLSSAFGDVSAWFR